MNLFGHMTVKFPLVWLIFTVLTACTPQQNRIAATRSGFPEGVFLDRDLSSVRNTIIRGCDMNGIPVTDVQDNRVLCSTTMSGGDAVLAQLAVGNSYSTTPSQSVAFTMYTEGDNVRVTARQWIESQTAFGQNNRMTLRQNKHFNDMQRFLYSLGAKRPGGGAGDVQVIQKEGDKDYASEIMKN